MRNTKKISNLLTKNIGRTLPHKTEEELSIINYGLETIIMNLYKLVIIIILAYLLHITHLVLMTFLISGSLRFFTSGVHAQNWYICIAMSIFNFIGTVLISTTWSLPYFLSLFMALSSLVIISIYAPADTHSKPMLNPRKRHLYRYLSVVCATLLLTTSYFYHDQTLINITVISVFLIAIYTTPFSYHLLKQPYSNYKTYDS